MATHHVRHQSHPSKKSQPAHARPSRPLSKRAHSLGSKAAAASKSAPYPKPDYDNNNTNDDDDSMAVSFLNYWYVITQSTHTSPASQYTTNTIMQHCLREANHCS